MGRYRVLAIILPVILAGCASSDQYSASADQLLKRGHSAADGPVSQSSLPKREDGDAAAGKEVFRFETFGNEGFWTDAVRMPAGIERAKVTPLQALKLGLSFDVDALDTLARNTLEEQLKGDPSGVSSAMLNDPKVLAKLVNANAVIGMPFKAGKVGVSCALCHTITDGSVFSLPNAGSVGHRLDGRTNHRLDIGKILATGANSRALYPLLQLALKANGGKTFGRAPKGLTETSNENEVDAYLSNPEYYPVGMFDDTFDGNGNPMHITPLFRQDLAGPFGSEGTIARLDNFSNLVYTVLFDPTNLTTKGGRELLHKLAGAAGDELADNYVKVLEGTGVKGYPFVRAPAHPNPGSEEAFIGVRVDNRKLLDLNAYEVSLPAPAGSTTDVEAASRGRELFRTRGCTGCHNVDQSKAVPSFLVAMKQIFPGDNPMFLAKRDPPLTPVQDTPSSFFDDKMAVVNASARGDIRGIALPLLLDLTRKPVFLHDDSVPSLERLLDPGRGADAPHPFYISGSKELADMVLFLKGLDTNRSVR